MRKYIAILLLLVCGFISRAYGDTLSPDGEILYISSYNADTPYSNEFTDLFLSDYRRLGGKLPFAFAALNCHSLSSRTEWMAGMKAILAEHPHARMIILYGPEAWACYFSLTEERYRRIPLCCVASQRYGALMEGAAVPLLDCNESRNGRMVDFLEQMKGFNVRMCYYYEYGLEEDMEVLGRLCPDVENIAVISDNSFGGLSMLHYVQSVLERNHSDKRLILIDGSRQDMQEAVRQVRELPPHTAVIFCVWRYDKREEIYMSRGEQVFSKETSGMPVISLTGAGFGSWALGGSHPQYSWDDGRKSPGSLAYALLDRGVVSEPYFYRIPNGWHFDVAAFRRLGLEIANLPQNAQLIHQETISWEDIYIRYKGEVILAITLVLTLFVSLLISVVYSVRIRRMQQSLLLSERQLRLDKEILEKSEQNLRKAKEKAEQSDRMKSRFIQNMTHEIRTPLNAIQGFSQVILDSDMTLDEAARSELNAQIEKNTRLMTRLIDDILELSVIESGPEHLALQSVCCNEVCREALPSGTCDIKPGVRLAFTSDADDSYRLMTSGNYLRKVLEHLLQNACKFTEQGEILLHCSLSENPGQVTFSVADTGPGIPQEKAEEIFDRFIKLDDFVQGTGLGLSLCREIAIRLGGTVQVDTTYTAGARFLFILPVDQKDLSEGE